MSITIKVDMSRLDRLLDALGDSVEEATRPAAQAGAQVLYNEVKRNVARIGKKSGNLSRSIYQAFSKDNSGPGYSTYHISWNATKAPHGHLVEYGHIQRYEVYLGKDGKWHTNKRKPIPPVRVAARPFIRPAQSMFPNAVSAAEAALLKKLGML